MVDHDVMSRVGGEACVDVEVRGRVLIMRVSGVVDDDAYRRLFPPIFETYLCHPGTRMRTMSVAFHARVKGLRVLKTMAKHIRQNRPFVERAAFVRDRKGLTGFIFDQLVALSGRDDLRLFESEADALAWLTSDGDEQASDDGSS